MPRTIQEIIHQLEVGGGVQWLRGVTCLLGLLGLAALWDLREARNLARPEAMDAAQVARQLATGQGFTTQFIRPLSVAVLEARSQSTGGETNDPGWLRRPHPDLANPPAYPLVLAAAMRALPFEFELGEGRAFRFYQPDVLITLVNQCLLVGVIVVTFLVARRLFDASVGWWSALLVTGTASLWELSNAGVSLLLVMFWVVLLAWCLVMLEGGTPEEPHPAGRVFALAALAGLLVGLAALSRYAAAWLLVPVIGYLLWSQPGRRGMAAVLALLAFLLVVTPWVSRNMSLSGHPLGVADCVLLAGPDAPDTAMVERSFHVPDDPTQLRGLLRRLVVHSRGWVRDELPRLGGSWVSALFLAGLCMPFVQPARGRVRVFVLASLGLLVLVEGASIPRAAEAMAGTAAANAGIPLTLVLAPLVLMFSAAFFVGLLEQWDQPELVRRLAAAGFLVAAWTPLMLALLPPRPDPRVHPPYHPPGVQQIGRWFSPQELLMSDVPWAVAWYGNRPCLWLPRHAQSPRGEEDFFAVNDLRRSVHGLYLTQVTLDERFFSDIYQRHAAVASDDAGAGLSWGDFAFRALARTNLPPGFPLKYAHGAFAAFGHLIVADRQRWRTEAITGASARPEAAR